MKPSQNMNWLILPLIWAFFEQEYLAGPVPLKLSGHTKRLTPYIQHWEAANYDRAILDVAHKTHIEQKHHRWKRSMSTGEYGPAHVIKLNFFAHDKEFKVVLKQDPLSVFATDVEFENTHGPIDYDITRIYTGSLEDEDSLVHAVLTNDNLLDGTIETSTDYYYIEPTHRYSQELSDSGVHSIIYKVNDVDMKKYKSSSLKSEHCASERLRLKKTFENLNEQNFNNSNSNNQKLKHLRRKRWLPDEYNDRTNNERPDPPLPLDLDVPYNDDLHVLTPINKETVGNKNEKKTAQDIKYGAAGFNPSWPTTASPTKSRTPFRRGGGGGNGSNGSGDNYKISNRSYDRTNSEQKFYTKHKNIIVSTYDNSNNNNLNRSHLFERHDDFGDFIRSNGTSRNGNSNGSGSDNDRPSHKTHVEIITKNGATRRPYIIVNNYNPPDQPANSQYPQFNSMLMTNLLSNKGPNEFGSSSSDSTNARSNYNRKITCMLYLQADHTFFQKMGSDEASIEAITRHVQRANSIYKNTDFNNDGKPDNITFMIKRIKVHNMNALNDPSYRFPGNYGVEKFLELFSEEDYDAFCLAYMFTYRDFEMGTLGLAWTGDLKNAGGVCEKNGHYRGSLKSLNTGIVTLLNYGKHVPPAVSHVTLAHEIGHNFGSPHDPEQCTPGGEDGNFIMFARATSGDKKNNNKFSPCSLKSIEPVLNSKARSPKGCFTEPQTSICGNGVVEPGEECDCGWEEDCKDACCFPMSRHPRMDERPCTLTPGSLCSQSQGPCCTNDCRLKFGDKCRDDNGCRDPSFCDGRMPQCPPSVNKPNKTICNKEFVCFMGECTGSICLAYGLESCQCIPGENDDKIKSCELCCKLPGEDKPCRSSFEWNEAPYDVPNMYAKPGTPCNDYNGYCDVFQKCREVDPSGPLATLRKLLLSEESIATFKNWMQNNWYAVVLGAIAIVVLLILITKLLAKRSNLKLKTVTIIHSATTETVRLPTDNNGVIVHRAVRTKVPFKKKVRGKRNVNKKKVDNKSSAKETKERPTEAANELGKKRIQPLQQQQQQMLHKKSMSSGGASGNIVAGNAGIDAKEVSLAIGASAATTAAINTPPTTAVKGNSGEKPKKATYSKKHSKEIIDYSKRGGAAAHHAGNKRGSLTVVPNHTNTFQKVQKWLLESPIVAQPLSHIEHSKVRKVITKSQSTPERLIHKSPQKSKSMNNVAGNDKVRMQVVYKPFKFSPFKFSLRFSKNAKVRTHVLGGAGKSKPSNGAKQPFKVANGRMNKRPAESAAVNANTKAAATNVDKSASQARTAYLLQKHDEDNQILTAGQNEPTYETVQPPEPKFFEHEHIYEIAPIENMAGGGHSNQLSRSSSKTTQRASKAYSNATESARNSFALDNDRSAMIGGMQKSRDISGSTTSINNKYGSTQNLIKSKDANFSSSKNRHSVNSRTSKSREVKDLPLIVPASNAPNYAKSPFDNTTTVMPKHQSTRPLQAPPTLPGGKVQPVPVAAQRRASSNHLPRASISGTATGIVFPPLKDAIVVDQTPAERAYNAAALQHQPPQQPPPLPPPIAARTNHNMPISKTPSSSSTSTASTTASASIPERTHQRSNSLRQQPHSFVPPPLPRNSSVPNDEKLCAPSDMDQSISDVEYLVS